MHFQKPMLGVPLDWSNPLNKGLVMHLAMNEGHGDVVRDLSMNGNHGTLNNMAFPSTPASGWNPGRTGVGLKFDGTDDYVDCGNDGSLTLTDMTLSAWINPTVDLVSQSSFVGFIDKSDSWSLSSWSNGKIIIQLFYGDGGPWVAAYSTTILVADTWYHILGTIDGANLKIYINGVLEDTVVLPGTVYNDVGKSVLICNDVDALDRFFDGAIDQVRIHNRALTAKEVQDYYINPWSVYLDEEDM